MVVLASFPRCVYYVRTYIEHERRGPNAKARVDMGVYTDRHGHGRDVDTDVDMHTAEMDHGGRLRDEFPFDVPQRISKTKQQEL